MGLNVALTRYIRFVQTLQLLALDDFLLVNQVFSLQKLNIVVNLR